MHINVCRDTYMCVSKLVYMHTHAHTHTHTHTDIYICWYIYMYMYGSIYTYRYKYGFICIYIYIYTHIIGIYIYRERGGPYVSCYVRATVCVYVYPFILQVKSGRICSSRIPETSRNTNNLRPSTHKKKKNQG